MHTHIYMYTYQTHNGNLEDRVGQLLATLEEVSQARVHQAQQLAEARQKQANSKTKTIVESSQDKANIERLGGELETSQQQLDEAKHREREVSHQSLFSMLTQVPVTFFSRSIVSCSLHVICSAVGVFQGSGEEATQGQYRVTR